MLDKLETMIELVSRYYRRPSRGLIECYVVRDIENFPAKTFPEGVIFSDFELSAPFDLGAEATFKAAQEGHLVVRCQDPWTELSDNAGELKIAIRDAEAP